MHGLLQYWSRQALQQGDEQPSAGTLLVNLAGAVLFAALFLADQRAAGARVERRTQVKSCMRTLVLAACGLRQYLVLRLTARSATCRRGIACSQAAWHVWGQREHMLPHCIIFGHFSGDTLPLGCTCVWRTSSVNTLQW